MRSYSSHVVNVAMRNEQVLLVDRSLRTPAAVKRTIMARQDDAGLLCAPAREQRLSWQPELSDTTPPFVWVFMMGTKGAQAQHLSTDGYALNRYACQFKPLVRLLSGGVHLSHRGSAGSVGP